MPREIWELVGGIATALFGAGVAWGVMRAQVTRTRNDLNGVRRIVNDQAAEQRTERERIRFAVLLLTPDADLEKMIDRLWP